ncbi:MAG: hypothetical protein AABX11_04790 [Nanoarchaeota archaeon]
MGGRKSYPTKKFLGDSTGVKKDVKQLKDYIVTKDVSNISIQTLNIFSKSAKPLKYSAYSTKFFPEIMRNLSKWKEEKDVNELRRNVAISWSNVKERTKISVPKEVDRIIIENAVKIVEGKK